MTRLILFTTAIFIYSASAVKSQEDFAQLSTKERINIAENEEKEASTDEKFLSLMQNGHELFKEKHYLKAIHAYEKAQDRRPYNVYPKVIIADIELSMKDTLSTLRAAEKIEAQREQLNNIEKPKEEVAPEKENKETDTQTEAERKKQLEKWENQERARLEREREMKKEREASQPAEVIMDGDVQKLTTDDLRKQLGQQYPAGITEETTTEGNKTIIKRVVVANNLGNEYKKVVHGWGGVFYFKNGEAVTERVWLQETEK